MNWADILAVIGALGGVGGVLAMIDWIRKRKRVPIDQSAAIANNAVQFIERLQAQTDSLQQRLNTANTRADDLSQKLAAANTRADDLQRKHDTLLTQLSDAQFEIRNLRLTVKTLSDAMDRRGN